MVNSSPSLDRCPKSNMNCKKLNSRHQWQKNNSLTIYHQKVCGLGNKTNNFSPTNFPDILCFTEHQLNQSQLEHIYLDNYTLGAIYRRQYLKKGGVSIFVHMNLKCSNININEFCKDQDIEACAIKLEFSLSSICITIRVYRAPSGSFKLFINGLDNIIKKLYKIGLKFIICDDININYLTENDMKKQLDTLLISYNLSTKVHFPTRIQNKSSTAIDNIFKEIFQFKNYIITPMINGLSNHDAQLLMINEINLQNQTCHINTIRNINKNSLTEFQINLSYESWDNIFGSDNDKDVDILFNSFLDFHLQIFYSSFPIKETK